MKKFFILLFIALFIIGCGKKEPIIKDLNKGLIKITSKDDIKKYGLVDAKEGECYKKELSPDSYKIVTKKVPYTTKGFKYGTKRVLYKKEGFKEITIPARYKIFRKKVMTKPVTYRIIKTPRGERKIKIPAQYNYVIERQLIEKERIKRIKTPAIYKREAVKIPTTKTTYKMQKVKELVKGEVKYIKVPCK